MHVACMHACSMHACVMCCSLFLDRFWGHEAVDSSVAYLCGLKYAWNLNTAASYFAVLLDNGSDKYASVSIICHTKVGS
jgi:hypothetical protein